jgi:hypothetical protein
MASVTSLYFNQQVIILDTSASSNATTGSLVLYGGLATNATSSLKATNISGIASITNSTISTNTASGALVVSGGVGMVT